jgi:hypothetical protein
MVTKHPKVEAAVHAINTPWELRQERLKAEAACKAEQQRQYEERKAKAQQYMVERLARRQDWKEKATVEAKHRRTAEARAALIQKLQVKVVSLTQDELQLARSLRDRGDAAFNMI